MPAPATGAPTKNLVELLIQRAQESTGPALTHKKGGQWQDVRHVAVHQAPSVEPLPPEHHVQPLYAVAVQTAQASGDLAQLKVAVQQGEQQLAHEGALRSALEQLNAEIARLEAR